METTSYAGTYRDLAAKCDEKTQYFFLENILKARIELHLETPACDYGEEVNMYLADLLASLTTTCAFTEDKPWVSPFDCDVASYIEHHHDVRTEYEVYKENADFGLAATSVFAEYHHAGSYWRRTMKNTGAKERIGLYYKLAASALAHLRGSRTAGVHVFLAIADHVADVSCIVRKISGDCFDFGEKLSAGSLFHLEKELADAAKVKLYGEKLDDFLKAYRDHRHDASPENRARLRSLASELSTLNPEFRFDEPTS